MFDPIPLLDEPPKEDDEDFVEEKELDKLRSISPVIWRRVGTGIKIEDCKKNRYEEAVRVVLASPFLTILPTYCCLILMNNSQSNASLKRIDQKELVNLNLLTM